MSKKRKESLLFKLPSEKQRSRSGTRFQNEAIDLRPENRYIDESIFFWYMPHDAAHKRIQEGEISSKGEKQKLIPYIECQQRLTVSALQNNYIQMQQQQGRSQINQADFSKEIYSYELQGKENIFQLEIIGVTGIIEKLQNLYEHKLRENQSSKGKNSSDNLKEETSKGKEPMIEIDIDHLNIKFPNAREATKVKNMIDQIIQQKAPSKFGKEFSIKEDYIDKIEDKENGINENQLNLPNEQGIKKQATNFSNLGQPEREQRGQSVNVEAQRLTQELGLLRNSKDIYHPIGFVDLSDQLLNKMYSVENDMGLKLQSNVRYQIHKEDAKLYSHDYKKKSVDITMQSIVIEAQLFLGSKPISEKSYSQTFGYSNNIQIQNALNFQRIGSYRKLNTKAQAPEEYYKNLIQICELPSFARICINIIGFKTPHTKVSRDGFILGSTSITIFNYQKQLRTGNFSLKLWPFQKINPQMVCQSECRVFDQDLVNEDRTYKGKEIQIQVGFKKYQRKVIWALSDEVLTAIQQANIESQILEQSQAEMIDDGLDSKYHSSNRTTYKNPYQSLSQSMVNDNERIKKEGENLKQVKRMLDRYPLEEMDKEQEKYKYQPALIFQSKKYVDILPSFVKAVNFTNEKEVKVCYNYLQKSQRAKDLKPEEALALLEPKYGDEMVRLFAVQKIAQLDDYNIALYMPQLVQALKAELFHCSFLSEFLLERAIKNTGVVGHVFFWNLKASLHDRKSYERYYLIIERFLMCCGRFKFTLFNQNLLNRGLMQLSSFFQNFRDEIGHIKFIEKKHEYLKFANFLIRVKQIEVRWLINYLTQQEESDYDETQMLKVLQEGDLIFKEVSSKLIVQSYPFYKKMTEEKKKRVEINTQELEEGMSAVDKQDLDLYLPLEPKKPISRIAETINIFSSKKLPLYLVAILRQDNIREVESSNCFLQKDANQNLGQSDQKQVAIIQEKIQRDNEFRKHLTDDQKLVKSLKDHQKCNVLFKFGDDLRQDNLVLQIFKLMDKLWVEQGNLNLEMLAYGVFETGYEMGYLELMDNAEEFAEIYKMAGNHSPFQEDSLLRYINNELWDNPMKKANIKIDREQYLQNFIKSLASQIVGTYILNIGDRHCGNYMFQKYTGKFFHIDFGHILTSKKQKFGINIEVEPFIYQRQFKYFIENFKTEPQLGEQGKTGEDDSQNDAQENIAISRSDTVGRIMNKRHQNEVYEYERIDNKGSNRNNVASSRTQSSQFNGSVQANKQNTSMSQKAKYQNQKASKRSKKRGSSSLPDEEGTSDYDLEESKGKKRESKKEKNENIKLLETYCCQAYRIIRQNSHVLINLLMLMAQSGITRLNDKGIMTVTQRLKLQVSDEEAENDFKKQMEQALRVYRRKITDYLHLGKHQLGRNNLTNLLCCIIGCQ